MAFPLQAVFLRRLQPPAERPPCPPPSASSLLIAPRAAEVSGALLPQLHLFPMPFLPAPPLRRPVSAEPPSSRRSAAGRLSSHGCSKQLCSPPPHGASTSLRALCPFCLGALKLSHGGRAAAPPPLAPALLWPDRPPPQFERVSCRRPWRPAQGAPSLSNAAARELAPDHISMVEQPPLQRASPFPSLRSSSAKRRCSCSHGVQVPVPSPPIQKQQPCAKPLLLLLSDVRRVLDEMCSSLDGSARCRLAVLLRSEQHAVMPVGGLLFLRSPVVVVVHPGEAT
jgi:hypothetical protein